MADNTGDLVLFWDGKEYAAQYLDKALPGLTERVKHSEALVEKWPSLQMRSANWVFCRDRGSGELHAQCRPLRSGAFRWSCTECRL